MIAILLALALSAPLAHADFSVDADAGQIRCQGSSLKVGINAQRNLISVTKNGEIYQYIVGHRNSDGDSFVSYMTQSGGITLSFDDRGDSIEFARGGNVVLDCR